MNKINQEEFINRNIRSLFSNSNKHLDHVKITSSNGITKINIQLSDIVDGVSRYEIDYRVTCTRLGLNPIWIGKISEWKGVGIKLLGVDINKKTKCVVFLNINNDEKIYLSPENARKAMG